MKTIKYFRRNFKYCQSQIEKGSKCKKQCMDCKIYYKHLENEYYEFEIKLTIIIAIIIFIVGFILELI